MTTLLIDADVVLWRACSAAQGAHDWGQGLVSTSANLHQAIQRIESDLQHYQLKFNADDMILALSDPKPGANWRKTVLPTYKAGRHKTAKPIVFWQAREHLEQNYKTEQFPGLEGDDVMGLFATGNRIKGKRIIVSIDKDMQSVPGHLYNPNRPQEGVRRITEQEADLFHLTQTLTGDRVDEYGGCPGVGPKRAAAALQGQTGKLGWALVLKTYKKAGYDEAYALRQARVARILRFGEYSRKSGDVKLWEPQR